MSWKSGPIQMFQFMWYAPGTGKGAARPYIGTICSPSTQPRAGEKDEPVVGVGMTPLWLQCHLWVMHLLRQDCLGWSHQNWQITHPRAVQINLLHSNVALKPPGTNFHGGIKILVCWPILDQLASGMHGLACVSATYCVFLYTTFWGCTV